MKKFHNNGISIVVINWIDIALRIYFFQLS